MRLAFPELEVVSAFAVLAVVWAVVRSEVRCLLPSVVGFVKFDAATKNPDDTEGATFVTTFHVAPSPYVCLVILQPPVAFPAFFASRPHSSEESSS